MSIAAAQAGSTSSIRRARGSAASFMDIRIRRILHSAVMTGNPVYHHPRQPQRGEPENCRRPSAGSEEIVTIESTMHTPPDRRQGRVRELQGAEVDLNGTFTTQRVCKCPLIEVKPERLAARAQQ